MYRWGPEICGDVTLQNVNGISIPVYATRPHSLPETLRASAGKYPDKLAIIDERVRLTYIQFEEKVLAFAWYLHHQAQLYPGDRVAVIVRNSAEFCIAVYGALSAGIIVVPVSTKLKAQEMAVLLNDAEVKAMVVENESRASELSAALQEPCFVILQQDVLPLSVADVDVEAEIRGSIDELDAAFMMYTSGTTGTPKGTVLTHFNAIHGAINYERCYGLTHDDTTVIAVPIFHGTGLMAQLVTFIYLGGTVVLLETFDAKRMLDVCQRERVTYTICVPTIYTMLLQEPTLHVYSLPLRILGVGGAPLPSALYARMKSWLPSAQVLNTYGLTEATSPALMTPPEMAEQKVGSVGIASPIIKVVVTDLSTGEPVPPGNHGEIRLKGALITFGYWKREDATKKTLVDGWLKTGDVGYMDEDGFVFIRDRVKDVINRGGEKVFSIEVESAIVDHPGVLEAAAVGVPDDTYGEVVKVFVVPKPGYSISEEELVHWVGERLAKFKVPKYVVFRDSLPRNDAGKVLKRVLQS